MKITVLVDNNSRIDNYLLAEPALSLLIEHKDKKILFDTGFSNVFIQNAKALTIDLNNITDTVISHEHNDHHNKKEIYCRSLFYAKIPPHVGFSRLAKFSKSHFLENFSVI